jgi:hypothetical protein
MADDLGIVFSELLKLPAEWFEGSNVFFYVILPMITSILLIYFFLEKIRVYQQGGIANVLLSVVIGIWGVFLGKLILYFTIPAIILLKVRSDNFWLNIILKVVCVFAALWLLATYMP